MRKKFNDKPIEILLITATIPPATSGDGIRALRSALEISKSKNTVLVTRTLNKNISIPHYTIFPEKVKFKSKLSIQINKLINITVLPWVVFLKLFWIPKPDIIHSFSVNWLSIFIVLYNRLFWKSKLLIELTLMGSDVPKNKNRWWLYRKLTDYCINQADQVICISPQLYEYMIEIGYDSSKLLLIPCSIDDRFLSPSAVEKEKLRMSLGYKPDELVIITVAHVTVRKGYLLIQDIIKQIPSDIPFKFISIGSFESQHQNKLMNDILKNLEESGRSGKLVFEGYKDPLPYLQASDIFLFASGREGFGTAVVEAMSCGLPVIAKKLENITDYIINNDQTGFIVDSDDPNHFVEKIKLLYNDTALREEMGTKAKTDSTSRFSMKTITNLYLECYKVLNKVDQ